MCYDLHLTDKLAIFVDDMRRLGVGLLPPCINASAAEFDVEVDAEGVPSVRYALAAIIRMRPAPRQIPKVAEVAQRTPEVVECHRVTGEDCFYMKVHVRSVEHLEEVIDRFVVLGQTTTAIVQSSPVPPRAVALGEEDARGR